MRTPARTCPPPWLSTLATEVSAHIRFLRKKKNLIELVAAAGKSMKRKKEIPVVRKLVLQRRTRCPVCARVPLCVWASLSHVPLSLFCAGSLGVCSAYGFGFAKPKLCSPLRFSDVLASLSQKLLQSSTRSSRVLADICGRRGYLAGEVPPARPQPNKIPEVYLAWEVWALGRVLERTSRWLSQGPDLPPK